MGTALEGGEGGGLDVRGGGEGGGGVGVAETLEEGRIRTVRI